MYFILHIKKIVYIFINNNLIKNNNFQMLI